MKTSPCISSPKWIDPAMNSGICSVISKLLLKVVDRMQQVLHHPFSLIMASPSNGGKSTLAYNIVKNSQHLVAGTDNHGFDSVWIIYRSFQPLYRKMVEEFQIPVHLFEKSLPRDLESLLADNPTKYPIIIVDDGICKENEELVLDLFCRLGHHLSISVILICQSIYDSKNPVLRVCHRNTKALIVFACPRDHGTLRILIQQMIADKKKQRCLLSAVENELQVPYRYVMFDFHPLCPPDLRYKTNFLCENEPFPIALVFK